MTSFDITIPGRQAGDLVMTLQVEATNWLEALRKGLEEFGEELVPEDAICDIQPDGMIRVTDPSSDRTFVVSRPGSNGSSGNGLAPDGLTVPTTTADYDPLGPPPADRSGGSTPDLAPGGPAHAAPWPAPENHPVSSRPPPEALGSDIVTIVCQAVPDLDSDALTAEQIIDSALDLAWEHIGCEAAQVLLPTGEDANHRVVAARGVAATKVVRGQLELGEDIARLVTGRMATVRMSAIDVMLRYVKLNSFTYDLSVKTLLWVPIRHRGRLLAVMMMLNSANEDGFSDGEVSAVDYLSMTLAKTLVKHL